ncbi:MAG: cytochrome c1 [Epsilonproteobacteria bacterium]|nr:cytochrome c1 [Campylobacterota bacterium]
MKELKILGVVVFFTLLTYWGVEPYAHSVMHPHVESDGFKYDDLPALTKKGDAQRGAQTFLSAGCTGCHGVKAAGMPAPMDPNAAAASFGVNPPDLSNAGSVYDEKFLAALIKNPEHALMVEHKFSKMGRAYPMPAFYGVGGDKDQEVADIVAYLKSIAKKDVTPKEAYELACGRCHAMHYDNWTQIGEKPKFKHKKDELLFEAKVLEYQDHLTKYLGKLPPDLSMYIRSRGEHYLKTFMENPQNLLHGTAMPRVGVTAEAAEKVLEHMADVGDAKRHERTSVGVKVMIYLFIFAILAYLWKQSLWRELH